MVGIHGLTAVSKTKKIYSGSSQGYEEALLLSVA